jgi:hypothetical protein
MATAPAAASALLSETEEPPPPVLGAPAGTAPPDFADEPPALVSLELLDFAVLEEPPAVLGGTATVEPPLLTLLAGVAVADGSAAAEPVPLDLAADESLLDLLEPLLDPPVEVSIFMPGGMADMSVPDAEWDAFAVGAVTATVLPPEEDDEPVEEAADVDFAVGSVTTVVLPPEEDDEPVEEEADVDLALGRLVAPVLLAPVGTSVGALVAVAAGAPALDVVSFCDHRPISESTPARTAIAMIAPTTQDVLFG